MCLGAPNFEYESDADAVALRLPFVAFDSNASRCPAGLKLRLASAVQPWSALGMITLVWLAIQRERS